MRSDRRFRAFRLLLGLVAPPILGSILFLILALIRDTSAGLLQIDRLFDYFAQLHVVIFFAFVFVGIQSLAFSLIMEFVVRPGVSGLRYFLLISCLLGLLSGCVPGVLVDDLVSFLPVGALVGIIVGFLIYDRGVEVGRGKD